MALIHEFLLIKHEELNSSIDLYHYVKHVQRDQVVEISDDMICYFQDSLNWMKTYNPSIEKYQYGLNYYGISYLDKNGIEEYISIFKAWSLLFTSAPKVIKLTGNFILEDEDTGASGAYEKFYVPKHEILEKLNRLVEFGEKVRDEDYVVVYFGI